MGPLARQPRGDRVLGVGGDVEFGTELGARAAGAAFGRTTVSAASTGADSAAAQRLKAHGICQARLQHRHVHDPGQRVVALLGSFVKAHLAVLVGVRLHLQHGRRMLRVGPAAHGFQQRAQGIISASARTSPSEGALSGGPTSATRRRSRASKSAKVRPTTPAPILRNVCAIPGL